MHVTKYGIIGSSGGISRKVVWDKLAQWLQPGDEVVSGRSPKGGVDIDAEEYADVHGHEKIIHPPDYSHVLEDAPDAERQLRMKEANFRRNGLVASDSEVVLAFIPRRRYKDGTWNTLWQYVELGKRDFHVYDENGAPWDVGTLPGWARRRSAGDQKTLME
jgi:hypothetical protein